MKVISTRDFRSNQTMYLNMVQSGEDIILRSRAGRFRITPLSEKDSPETGKSFESDLRLALKEVAESRKGNINLKTAKDLLNEL